MVTGRIHAMGGVDNDEYYRIFASYSEQQMGINNITKIDLKCFVDFKFIAYPLGSYYSGTGTGTTTFSEPIYWGLSTNDGERLLQREIGTLIYTDDAGNPGDAEGEFTYRSNGSESKSESFFEFDLINTILYRELGDDSLPSFKDDSDFSIPYKITEDQKNRLISEGLGLLKTSLVVDTTNLSAGNLAMLNFFIENKLMNFYTSFNMEVKGVGIAG